MTRPRAFRIGALVVVVAAAVVAILAIFAMPQGQRRPSAAHRTVAALPTPPAAPAPRGPQRGGTLLALASDDFLSLDPGQAYDALDYEVLYATQRPLYSFRPSATRTLTPDLASGPPQISAGGRVVTVHIRHGVHFSPPVDREVTSADVAYAIERGANPHVATPYFKAYFGDLVGAAHADGGPIAGIATPNRYTIVFTLDRPIGAFFAQALSLLISAPVPAAYARPHDAMDPSNYQDWEVSTGPYMIANGSAGHVLGVGWIAHTSLVLIRNPNWRASTDFRPAYVDRIEIALNADADAIAQRVLEGADALQLNIPDSAGVTAALQEYPGQIRTIPDAGLQYAALDEAGPFANVDVRRALWAAVDRVALADTLGDSEPAQPGTHFIYPGVPGFAQAGGLVGPRLDFNLHTGGDLALARTYMRRAGYARGRYAGRAKVVVIGVAAQPGKMQARIFNRALEELGFKTSLRLTGEVNAYSQCAVARTVPTVCPDLGYTRDFDDAETVIAPTFADVPIPSIRAAIAAAAALSGQARVRAWAHVDRLLVADAVAIPFAFTQARAIESADVSGVIDQWEPGNWDLSFTWLNSRPAAGVVLVA